MGNVKHTRTTQRGNPVSTQHLVVMWENQHLSLEQIGKLVGMSRQAVRRRLVAAGVSTAKSKRWVEHCAYCGVQLKLRRCEIRKADKHFCSADHYYASRSNPSYYQWRYGQRLARTIVAQHFDLDPDHVVHHKDADNRNNDLRNLLVFASNSDHLKHHHGRKIAALWDGATVRP